MSGRCNSLISQFIRIPTWHSDVSGDVSGELDDVREVVLVPAVVLATVRLKQVITWATVEKTFLLESYQLRVQKPCRPWTKCQPECRNPHLKTGQCFGGKNNSGGPTFDQFPIYLGRGKTLSCLNLAAENHFPHPEELQGFCTAWSGCPLWNDGGPERDECSR